MRRYRQVPSVLLAVLGIWALVYVSSLHGDTGPTRTAQIGPLTLEIFTRYEAEAEESTQYLADKLADLERTLAVEPTRRPLIRIYDPDNFPNPTYDWAAAYYDGSDIYVCVNRLSRDVSSTLIHEYTHFLVGERANAVGDDRYIPGWLNEGLAQWAECQPPIFLAPEELVSISSLEPSGMPRVYYSESLLLVDFLVQNYGEERTLALIDAYARGDFHPLGTLGLTETDLLSQLKEKLTKR